MLVAYIEVYALRLDDFFFAMSSPYMGVMNFRHRADSEI